MRNIIRFQRLIIDKKLIFNHDTNIMKKIITLLIACMAFLPLANAGFIFSELSINVDEPEPIPVGKSVSVDANITLKWGAGSIIPIPLTVYVEAKDVPDWLTVTPSPSQFSITPAGVLGGSESKNVKIVFQANKEIEAFVGYEVKIHAYTNGTFLIKGSEATAYVYPMEDFVDKGLFIEARPVVNLYKGEGKKIYFNVTNNCNAKLIVEIEEENATGFSFSSKKFSLSPNKRKKVYVEITPDVSKEANVIMKFNYYPEGYENKKNYEEISLTLISKTKGGGGGALAIGLVIIIIGIILFIIWKKKK